MTPDHPTTTPTTPAAPASSSFAFRRRAPRVVRDHPVLSGLWKVGVAAVGSTVLLAGVVMLIAPGPAFVVIPAGLAILATEFAWAHTWLSKARAVAARAASRSRTTSPRRRRLAALGLGAVVVAAAVGYVHLAGFPPMLTHAWEHAAR